MLLSLALIFMVGLGASALCRFLKLPGILGLLGTGIFLGPFCLNLLDQKLLGVSPDLRQIALIIILLKAGLSLNLSDLRKVGRPALLMSCIPAGFEILAFFLFAPRMFAITGMEAALMGAVVGAVSPAVVVPRMVSLIEERRGTKKAIPQLILAGASCDDVFVIVLFSAFVNMAQGGSVRAADFVSIPVSIFLGILLGAGVGWGLNGFFETACARGRCVRNSVKVIVLLSVSFLFMAGETWAKAYVPVSGLLAIMSMACVLNLKSKPFVSKRLSEKLGKLWLAAEIILFVLVGAAVDIRYTLGAGLAAVGMIALALAVRSVGVLISMTGTPFNKKERLFCIFAYLPKATVQAAIGSIPLALGLPCGRLVLSVAVLAIVITAPLGAFLIDRSGTAFLEQEPG